MRAFDPRQGRRLASAALAFVTLLLVACAQIGSVRGELLDSASSAPAGSAAAQRETAALRFAHADPDAVRPASPAAPKLALGALETESSKDEYARCEDLTVGPLAARPVRALRARRAQRIACEAWVGRAGRAPKLPRGPPAAT